MSNRRVVIMASGNGTNAQVLLNLVAAGDLDCQIVALISDHSDAPVIRRAAAAGVRTEVVEQRAGESRTRYDQRLAPIVSSHHPDLLVMAGWMRILTGWFCQQFAIINLHPALPGAFPGANAIPDAFAAWRAGLVSETGVMVHWVPDAGVDTGPVIASEAVRFEPDDTLDTITERIHAVEHRLLPLGVTIALESLPVPQTPEVSR
ncbi:MAG: phosphoribosylglycinamide formyltransferase [Acidimicrobiales bacterium]|nr:phosphoribosylglycinamide formyltransferase [Acidimicrobiales bacterium]